MNRRGFTFVELMAVIIIIGILMGFVVMQMDYLLPKYRLRGQARLIGNIINTVRSKAALSGNTLYIEYDLDEEQVWFLYPPEEEEDDDYYDDDDEDAWRDKYDFDDEDDMDRIREDYEVVGRQTLDHGIQITSVQVGPNQDESGGIISIEVTPFGSTVGHIVHIADEDEIRQFSIEVNPLTAEPIYHEELYEYEELEEYDN